MATKQDSERTRFERPEKLLDFNTKARIISALRYGILGLVLLYLVFPLYWLTVSGFKVREDLFADPTIIPTRITLDNFIALWHTDFPLFLMNSIIVGVGTMVITVILSLLGGYGLARTQFRGRRNLARIVLFTYMFPPIVIGIPLYGLFFRLGLVNSRIGLIIAHTAISLPFAIWLMWQFFQTIPLAFEESAWIAGASRRQTFREIVIPMSYPGVIAVAIFAFAVSWSDFTLAVILMTETAQQTHPVGIHQFLQQDRAHWGILTAAGLVIVIPAFALVFFLQKYILIGFKIGG